jgi:hypothetical protein
MLWGGAGWRSRVVRVCTSSWLLRAAPMALLHGEKRGDSVGAQDRCKQAAVLRSIHQNIGAVLLPLYSAGIFPVAVAPYYAAAKGGLVHFTRS